MRTFKNMYFILAAFLFALMLRNPVMAAGPDPVEQVKPVIGKITAMLTTDAYKKQSREEQFRSFLALASERFDFDEMSKRVLGPQWNSLTAEQKNLFKDRFSQLLGYTYMDKIDTYNGEAIVYGEPRFKGADRAVVPTSIRFQNGSSVAISYIMQLKGSEWTAYDIVAENISLVRNYTEQLRSVLQKSGFDGLIRQLNEKIGELKTARTAKK